MDKEVGLLASIRAGNGQAFATLVRPYDGRMHAVARCFFQNDEDGADAVQEALLAAYRSIGSFQGNAKLWTWLYRILINACFGIRRSLNRHRAVPLDDLIRPVEDYGHPAKTSPRWTESAYFPVAQAETRAQVRACIERLPDCYRTILLLRDIAELNTHQAARRLGTSRHTVKSRLHRARHALKLLLEPMLRTEQLHPISN